jgi:hypothetical protein
MEFKKKEHALKIFPGLPPGTYEIELVGKIKISPSSRVEQTKESKVTLVVTRADSGLVFDSGKLKATIPIVSNTGKIEIHFS